MFYQPLAQLTSHRPPVTAALIGAGYFGSGLVAQTAFVPALRVPLIADPDLAAARRAHRRAGIPDARILTCDTPDQARAALASDHVVITPDPHILFDLPFDVLIEATGLPEAGALHAHLALSHAKHVAMVTKEADAAVGPILKRLADRANLVYTAVEGDQHGMLIGLVCWARTLGLDVLCGGKALDGEVLLHPDELHFYSDRLPLTPTQRQALGPIPASADPADFLAQRRDILGHCGGTKPWDLVELTIAANSTKLSPDSSTLLCPPCHTTEIPRLLSPQSLGGLLRGPARIDAAQILRQPHEASFGGGVFIVVTANTDPLRELLSAKASITNPDASAALFMVPHHLLGVQAIGSVLAAALLKTPTAALDYQPRFDVVYRTAQPLPAGHAVGPDHSPELTAEILRAQPLAPHHPLPAALARGHRLLADLPAGTLLTPAHIAPPADSLLWSLRRQQDNEFNL